MGIDKRHRNYVDYTRRSWTVRMPNPFTSTSHRPLLNACCLMYRGPQGLNLPCRCVPRRLFVKRPAEGEAHG
jgi:hypothetical protein